MCDSVFTGDTVSEDVECEEVADGRVTVDIELLVDALILLNGRGKQGTVPKPRLPYPLFSGHELCRSRFREMDERMDLGESYLNYLRGSLVSEEQHFCVHCERPLHNYNSRCRCSDNK